MAYSYKAPTFEFGRAVSQLFTQPGGRGFAIRLILWTSVFIAIAFALFAKPYIGFLADILEASWIANENPQDSEAILGAYVGMGKYVLPMLGASLLLWAVYVSAETALHKRIFHDEDAGFIPLRFGGDELRVLLSQFLVYLIAFGIFLLSMVALIILAAIMGVAMQVSAILGLILGIVVLIAYIAVFWLYAYVSIRMAPTAALSVRNGNVSVAHARDITKKRAGNLFLAYLFLFIVGYVVISVIQMAALSMILSENSMLVMMGLSEENPTEIFAKAAELLQQPGVIIALTICGILYVIATVIWWLSLSGVANYAVQWWEETNDGHVFD